MKKSKLLLAALIPTIIITLTGCRSDDSLFSSEPPAPGSSVSGSNTYLQENTSVSTSTDPSIFGTESAETTMEEVLPEVPMDFEWVIEPKYEYDDIVMLRWAFRYFRGVADLCEPILGWDGTIGWIEHRPAITVTGIYTVEKYNKLGVIDLEGKLLTDVKFGEVATTPSGFFDLRIVEGHEEEMYSLDKNYILTAPDVGYGDWPDDYVYNICDNKVYAYDFGPSRDITDSTSPMIVNGINYSGNMDNFDWDLSECKVGLYYNREIVVPIEYDMSASWLDITEHDTVSSSQRVKENARIVFVKNNKIYVFDVNGNCYSDGIYAYAPNNDQESVYVNGYLTVSRNGMWGLIDVNGNEAVSCQFEDISAVYDGKAWAKQDGKWGVIQIIHS